jgi:hypothetical protein
MAIQGKQRPHQSNRTPAPDATAVRAPAGQGYGTNSAVGNPSSILPGQGGPQSTLARNMQDTADADGILAQVVIQGLGRHDEGNNEQTRKIDTTGYPVAHGMTRQQASGAVKVPPKCGWSGAVPVRRPS